MPIIQVRNASMQQLNSADALDVEANNFCAEWYDAVGGGSSFAAPVLVPLATERHNTAPEIYSMASSILTILQAGFYFFAFSANADSVDVVDNSFFVRLDEDPATGTFSEVPASAATASAVAGWRATAYNSVILNVKENYRYRLQAGSSGNPYNFIAGSKLSVFRLFKNG